MQLFFTQENSPMNFWIINSSVQDHDGGQIAGDKSRDIFLDETHEFWENTLGKLLLWLLSQGDWKVWLK